MIRASFSEIGRYRTQASACVKIFAWLLACPALRGGFSKRSVTLSSHLLHLGLEARTRAITLLKSRVHADALEYLDAAVSHASR